MKCRFRKACRTRVLFVFLSLFFCFIIYFLFYSTFIYYFSSQSNDIIVSLTSTIKRSDYELPIAIYSLLTQTTLPKEIRIYLQNRTIFKLEDLQKSIKRLDSSNLVQKLFYQIVRIHFVDEDFGPATKYLPILREFHTKMNKTFQEQRIIVCDDDHFYNPHLIATLDYYSKIYYQSIVAFRGWRSKKNVLEKKISIRNETSHSIFHLSLR